MRKSTFRVLDKTSPEEKLRIIRALYFIVYNHEDSLILQSTELFHVLGEILEGHAPEELNLNNIQKQALLEELEYFD